MAGGIATSESTTSTTYTALTTAGPSATVTITNGKAIVILQADMNGSNGSTDARMSFAVSGATTLAAADSKAILVTGTSVTTKTATFLVTGLTNGSNTFTAQYRTSANTSTFANRIMIVMPAN